MRKLLKGKICLIRRDFPTPLFSLKNYGLLNPNATKITMERGIYYRSFIIAD